MSTPPAILAVHRHVSEREPGAWDDCAWCSAVMLARLCHDATIPATHTEAVALRAASDDSMTGGSRTSDLLDGYARRYNWHPQTVTGWTGLWAWLGKPGRAAVAMGSMGAFPAGSPIRRWDPGFAGSHATFVARADNQLRVWWDDPLAPQGGTLNYQGQWLSTSDLSKFVKALGTTTMVVAAIEKGDIVQKPHTSEVPATIDVAADTPYFDLDGTTRLGKLTVALKGRLSPYEVGSQRAIYVGSYPSPTSAGTRRTVLVTPVAGSIKPVVDNTPYSQANLDAAKAAGVQSEKSRLRTLLGL